jgi:antitoxin component of MazEF toxin-antitoxin module
MKKMMMKKLTRLGNSSALVIDKPILELLGIGPETFLEISTDGKSLTLTPVDVRYPTKEEMDAAIDHVKEKYGDVLRRLGDPSYSSESKKSSESPKD